MFLRSVSGLTVALLVTALSGCTQSASEPTDESVADDSLSVVTGPSCVTQMFWGQNSGYGDHSGADGGVNNDWAFGSYKGECPDGLAVVGVSENPNEANLHAVRCCPPPVTQSSILYSMAATGGECTGISAGASYLALPVGQGSCSGDFACGEGWDWDFGYVKTEVYDDAYMAAVSQTTSGQQSTVMSCFNGNGSLLRVGIEKSLCEAQVLYGQNSAAYTGPDWDPNYYKGQCPAGQFVMGISAVRPGVAHAGAVHAILCCSP